MTCVAIVPAKDRADSIKATVTALEGIAAIDEVVVVDDGSSDNTSQLASQAGADVVVLETNIGKGGAVAAGLEARPDSDVYVLIDADLGDTATNAEQLLQRVLDGATEMAIAIPVAADGRGGFGLVKRVAGNAIQLATSQRMDAPLSGQRAITGERLRSIQLAPRFGLEVGMSIDLLRLGCTYEEIHLPIEHHHTGKTFAGFRHRAVQGVEICRAITPRIGVGGLLRILWQSVLNREPPAESGPQA